MDTVTEKKKSSKSVARLNLKIPAELREAADRLCQRYGDLTEMVVAGLRVEIVRRQNLLTALREFEATAKKQEASEIEEDGVTPW